jgi:protein involved in polysaccharide export with SLBB domain
MKTLLSSFFAALALLAPAGYGQAVLRAGDVFELRLSGMPIDVASEFAMQYTVSDDGKVGIPYIGDVRAAGLTTTNFAKAVERKLVADKIFTHPTAVINLQPQSRYVTIGGEVRSPQPVPWSTDLTLSVAIKRAGGVGEFGSLKKIKVTREGKSIVFNLTKADKDPNQNPKLLPGDEVEVL